MNFMKVLIVEEHELESHIIINFLKDTGLQPIVTSSAINAWQISKAEIPDVIILDSVLPDFDVIELCKRFRSDRLLKDIPILLINSIENKDFVLQGLQSGANDYITKPFTK